MHLSLGLEYVGDSLGQLEISQNSSLVERESNMSMHLVSGSSALSDEKMDIFASG